MDYIKIKNFDKYQHYHTKSITAWIKLYFSIMDDYEFEKLAPNQRWYFIGLLLLAGKMENNIPLDTKYLQKKLGGKSADIKGTIELLNGTLIIIIKDKIRIDKIREDSTNPTRLGLDPVKTEPKPLPYRQFAHLKITVEENKKLLDKGYSQDRLDDMYDSVENFKKNTNYTSLYLTAGKWLAKDDKKKAEEDDTSLKIPKNAQF